MGKVNKYTGSKLLGEELKRLRGARGLEDIVTMSKQSPLTSRIHPISAPTLSQIENGITMPSTEVLYTLSVLYGVSPSRLLHHIVEERLATHESLPETREETRDGLQAALVAGHWYEALALAIHGGRLARSESERLLWQANRAMALRKLGMRQDATLMLLECAESGQIAAEHRYMAHLYLAEVLAECGYVQTSAAHVERAIAVLPNPTPPALMASALRARVLGVLRVHEFGLDPGERVLRDALRDLDQIEILDSAMAPSARVTQDLRRAGLMGALGNTLIAIRDFKLVAAAAAASDFDLLEAHAELSLGALLRRSGQGQRARRHLERAENRALLLGDGDIAFRVYYELAELGRECADGTAGRYLLRCLRYWPLVQSRTPEVVHFEQLLRAGEVR